MSLGYWEIVLLVVVPATLWASWIDYKERRVPNWLNAALLSAGVVAQVCFFGLEGLGTACLGILVGFGLLILPWAINGMGAGDVKLMAAIGAWFGPQLTLVSFVVGAMIGGVVACIMILAAGKLQHAYTNICTIMVKMSSRKTVFSEFGSTHSFGETSSLLPYGVPLTAGSLAVLFCNYFQWV